LTVLKDCDAPRHQHCTALKVSAVPLTQTTSMSLKRSVSRVNDLVTHIIPICSTHLECTCSLSAIVVKVTVAYNVVESIATRPSAVTSSSIERERIWLGEVIPRTEKFNGVSCGWKVADKV
jgi:hypothetical protein